ncbi:MAG: hypothetical protein M1816_002398 [Peltula sp. TS41687]|nr:MAG: hypothetical protein M1816_002398 [Peltula sp. TS41687]
MGIAASSASNRQPRPSRQRPRSSVHRSTRDRSPEASSSQALRGLSAADCYENARQRADQTTDDFATYLDQLEDQLEPYEESHRKQHLLTKLRPELKQAIKAYPTRPKTRYELVSLASRLEQNIPDCRPSDSWPRKSEQPTTGQRKTGTRGGCSGKGRGVNQTSPSSSFRELRIEEKVISSDNKGKPRVTDEEKERRRKEKLCFYCGKPNHMVADCRTRQREQQPQQSGKDVAQ